MTVNDSLDEGSYGISIKVPAKLMEDLIKKGEKPPIIIIKIMQRMVDEMDTEAIIAYASGLTYEEPVKRSTAKSKYVRQVTSAREWNQSSFEDYISKLINRAERDADTADLISMLVAYIDAGPRPTSEELRIARGFGSTQKWYEELRVSKSRLTIAAKHMGLPSFFPRAYGSGMKRKHPMTDIFYPLLQKWFSENMGLAEKYREIGTPRAADYNL